MGLLIRAGLVLIVFRRMGIVGDFIVGFGLLFLAQNADVGHNLHSGALGRHLGLIVVSLTQNSESSEHGLLPWALLIHLHDPRLR